MRIVTNLFNPPPAFGYRSDATLAAMQPRLPPIREAAGRDAPLVAALWTEAYVTNGVGGRSEPYEETDFFSSAQEGDVFVAEDAGGISGVVVLRGPGASGGAVAAPEEAELSRLAVARRCRGRGIGRALAEHCARRAAARSWPAISLWSRPAQTEAHRLYESLGYRRLPERDSIDASGHARVVFRLELGDAERAAS